MGQTTAPGKKSKALQKFKDKFRAQSSSSSRSPRAVPELSAVAKLAKSIENSTENTVEDQQQVPQPKKRNHLKKLQIPSIATFKTIKEQISPVKRPGSKRKRAQAPSSSDRDSPNNGAELIDEADAADATDDGFSIAASTFSTETTSNPPDACMRCLQRFGRADMIKDIFKTGCANRTRRANGKMKCDVCHQTRLPGDDVCVLPPYGECSKIAHQILEVCADADGKLNNATREKLVSLGKQLASAYQSEMQRRSTAAKKHQSKSEQSARRIKSKATIEADEEIQRERQRFHAIERQNAILREQNAILREQNDQVREQDNHIKAYSQSLYTRAAAVQDSARRMAQDANIPIPAWIENEIPRPPVLEPLRRLPSNTADASGDDDREEIEESTNFHGLDSDADQRNAESD